MSKKILVTEYSAKAKVAESIRIVQLSDLHCCIFGENNSELLAAAQAACPDLILLTGDMINKRNPDTEAVESFLCGLAGLAPCFYSLGNHELKYRNNFGKKEFDNYAYRLSEAGICLLDNESVVLEIKGTEIEIYGFSADMDAYRKLKKPEYKGKIPEPCEAEALKLMLAHNPELYKYYENTAWNFVFSGHLHGGIIRIPGLGGLISPSLFPFPKYSGGLYQLKGGPAMLVSKGLGSHTIKLRINNPAELVILNINQD